MAIIWMLHQHRTRRRVRCQGLTQKIAIVRVQRSPRPPSTTTTSPVT
jgi:hypothetical protein